MDDGTALLRAVLETPADDAPRLVFADWLERDARPRRPERAEFIRAECRLAHLPCTRAVGPCPAPDGAEASPSQCPYCQAAGPLGRRRLDLWAARARTMFRDEISQGFSVWLAEGEPAVGPPAATVRRGFVAAIGMTTRAFLDRAAALFTLFPVVDVRLTDRRPKAAPGGGVRWVERPVDRTRPPRRLLPGPDVPSELFAAGLPDAPLGSAALADACLSAACVAYGRQLAGLPPLG